MKEVIKSYKGFNKNMACRDFQYEEGKDTKQIKQRLASVVFMPVNIRLTVLAIMHRQKAYSMR